MITVAEEAVRIKGTKNGLVILFNPDLDIEEVKRNLQLKMESSKGFFKGAKFSVYDSHSRRDHHYINELEGICRQYGLVPSGEVLWPPAAGGSPGEITPLKRKKNQVIPIRQQLTHPGGEQALLVLRTLRSGQSISSRYSIVIMGDVNPGAEVVSEGGIYVLGSCKGNVHAGAAGNLMAEVFALKLQPIILSIGSITADSPALPSLTGPVAARVSRGKIVLAKM